MIVLITTVVVMSLIVVGIGSAVIAVTAWAWAILVDEALYLRVVEPLASSPRFARLCGVVVSIAVDRRVRRHRWWPRCGRTLGRTTNWVMARPSFRHPWKVGHQMAHRHRRSLRVTLTILGLAALGTIAAVPSIVRLSAG